MCHPPTNSNDVWQGREQGDKAQADLDIWLSFMLNMCSQGKPIEPKTCCFANTLLAANTKTCKAAWSSLVVGG